MLCKRASNPEDAKPVIWRQVSPTGENDLARLPAHAGTNTTELERQVSELRAASQAEVARTKQAAFQEGLEQGRGEAAGALRETAQKLGTTLSDLATFRRKLRLDAEREVVKLSLAVAHRILNRELATDPDALEGVVHAALSKLQNRDTWQVRVGLQGADITKACLERAGLTGSVKVIIDHALQPGDLLIATSAGELDASINTQLHEIERGFAERLALR